MRSASYQRTTKETDIKIKVRLDGSGRAKVDTGVSFLDHMLNIFSTHSLIDIILQGKGDLRHHTAEDVGICLGEAIDKALGDRVGLIRFGYAMAPLEDALAYASIDLAKRPYSVIELKMDGNKIEDMVKEDIYHFIRSLVTSIKSTTHINVTAGENDHHKVEAAFKAFAIAFRQAVSYDPRRRGVPSSKGVL